MNVFLYAFIFKKIVKYERFITIELDKRKSHAIIKTITVSTVLYRIGNIPKTFMENVN